MAGNVTHLVLPDRATVAIIGGGPAGSFTALYLLKIAKAQERRIKVLIFEHRRFLSEGYLHYSGCPQCAGGLSPKMLDALKDLDIDLPAEVVQQDIKSIILQGRWKHIKLPVPKERRMVSVFRGVLPKEASSQQEAFDSLLLDTAIERGAIVIGSKVIDSALDRSEKPLITYSINKEEKQVTADLVVFAMGVNRSSNHNSAQKSAMEIIHQLQPLYRPPKLRKALIFELQASEDIVGTNAGELHFIESSVKDLKLDMCSILPKRKYFTVSLIGKSVDQASSHKENLELINRFLELPQIRRTLPPNVKLSIRCACNPSIVVGTARGATGSRMAVVGDLATCRQYKDGILSAHTMARSLAESALEVGVDRDSLNSSYGQVIARFRRDNVYAIIIFSLYRILFVNRYLSRVIYQTHVSEQKRRPAKERHFSHLMWAIASGDEAYSRIAWRMLRPRTLLQIFTGGVLVTMKTNFWEYFFGLNWKNLGRFPVAVSLDVLQKSRLALLAGTQHEREFMYRIHIRAGQCSLMKHLELLGESGRPYLNPRWVKIHRRSGKALTPGCIIDYRVFGGLIKFSIKQLPSTDPFVVRHQVIGGFSNKGEFIFQIEPLSSGRTNLSVLLAFNYPIGSSILEKLFWSSFRMLFPDSIHEVLWNHALCEFKQSIEKSNLHSRVMFEHNLT
ncbi:MAG: hypothetical protein ABJL54_02860 [Halioglobus sp.]